MNILPTKKLVLPVADFPFWIFFWLGTDRRKNKKGLNQTLFIKGSGKDDYLTNIISKDQRRVK
jgi:hypothetical protein